MRAGQANLNDRRVIAPWAKPALRRVWWLVNIDGASDHYPTIATLNIEAERRLARTTGSSHG